MHGNTYYVLLKSRLVEVIIQTQSFQHIQSVIYVVSFTLTGYIDGYQESFRLLQPDSLPSATPAASYFNELIYLNLTLNTGN